MVSVAGIGGSERFDPDLVKEMQCVRKMSGEVPIREYPAEINICWWVNTFRFVEISEHAKEATVARECIFRGTHTSQVYLYHTSHLRSSALDCQILCNTNNTLPFTITIAFSHAQHSIALARCRTVQDHLHA